jgi:hypothetical protein
MSDKAIERPVTHRVGGVDAAQAIAGWHKVI